MLDLEDEETIPDSGEQRHQGIDRDIYATMLEEVQGQGRGRGPYFCPGGLACTKGGVISGTQQLFEFTRNSDIRSVACQFLL